MVAISTIAFGDKSIEEIIDVSKKEGWMLEFSSGLKYHPELKEIYLKTDIPRLPHNYFPPPRHPFVLNLASKDNDIRYKSIQHCKQGLDLAKASQSQFFAAHAGFCGDPKPEELGKPISFNPNYDHDQYWENFTRAVEEIVQYAEILEIDFLIENNVCAPFNLLEGARNPLLCADPKEIIRLFETISSEKFGLLLDTAHFKISGNTLKFDYSKEVSGIFDYIKGIHHSDNNGILDTNSCLDEDYWFNNFMPEFSLLLHVIEVKNLKSNEIKQHFRLIEEACNP